MRLNHYQDEAFVTAVYPDIGDNIVYPTLGLAGEAGEVANQVKKVLRDDNGVITAERFGELVSELGDVLWYLAMIAKELDVPLEDIARWNLQKLSRRAQNDRIHGDKRKNGA